MINSVMIHHQLKHLLLNFISKKLASLIENEDLRH